MPGVLLPAQQQGQEQLRFSRVQADGSRRLLPAKQAQGRFTGAGGLQGFFQIVRPTGLHRFRRRRQRVQPGDEPGGVLAEVPAGRFAKALGVGVDAQEQRRVFTLGDRAAEPVSAPIRQLIGRADLAFFTQLGGVLGRGQQNAVAVAAGHPPLEQFQRFPSPAR